MKAGGRIVISDGLPCHPCSSNEGTRLIKYPVFIHSGCIKFNKQIKFHEINTRHPFVNSVHEGHVGSFCCVSLHYGSINLPKFVNFKLRVASIEHGLVCERDISSIEDDEGEEEDKELPMWDNWSLDRDVDCGVMNCNSVLMETKRDVGKLYYLEERDEEVLSKRILALSRTNKRVTALTLFKSMEFAGLRPSLHACNSLLSCLSRCCMLDDMLGVFAFMKRNEIISGHSCSLVLKALANRRGIDEALQLFFDLENDCEVKQHLDVIVYNTVISFCGKADRWFQMESVWKSMKGNGIIGTAITFRVLVCTFVRCGQYEIAIDAYCEMLQNGVKPGYDAMKAVIGACMKEEKWDLASSVFQSMLKCGMKPNLIACNALINSFGKVGKVKEAVKVYQCIKSLGHTPDSYSWNGLLRAFYRANRYADALKLFESLQKSESYEPNLHLYNTALMCCQKLGFWDKSLQILWKMENSGISIPTASYNIVINACEVGRKPKVALQVYEHMAHQNRTPDTFTLLSLVRCCIWGDLWSEVKDILDDSTPDVSLYNAAIHGMCLRGKFESAKKLYMKMRDIGLVPDGKTRALMLQYMQKDSK